METRSDTRVILLLRAFGILALFVGAAALWIAPIEVEVFYLFLPGHKFAYEGYNWGTAMFAYITIQVVGYYGIGLLGLVLGWGHVSLCDWTRPLMRSLLWAWLVAGAPLMAVAYLMLILSKGMTPVGLLASLPFALILYPLAPWLLYRGYDGGAVRRALANHESPPYSWDALPPSVGGTIALLLLYVLALQLPMMLNGLFPWFGTLLSGKAGLSAYGPLTLASITILWALVTRRPWGWWSAMVGLGVWALSNGLTFARYTLADILDLMVLPATELDMLQGVPFLHQPVALLCCLPPLVLMLVLVLGRRNYLLWSRGAATITCPE